MAIKRTYALNPIIEDVHKSTLYQPQMANHFELNLKLNDYIVGNTGITDSNGKALTQKYINLATTSFSLPTISTETLDIPYGNTTIHIAGRTQFGGADSITCIDYIGADIEGILYNWQMMVTNPETGQQGWAYNYKTDGTVIEYAPDGSCLSSWVLRGLFPTSIAYGDSLSKGDSSLKQITVSLSYDLAYKKFDSTTGRGQAAAEKAAEISATNMKWKDQSEYARYSPTNTGDATEKSNSGPLSLNGAKFSLDDENL